VRSKSWPNRLLFLALVSTVALCWIVKERDVSRPNYDFLPEAQMAYSVAYSSFSPNPNFADGLTLRSPPAGTIARGHWPLHYQATPEDALRAGLELHNPFSVGDESRQQRGSVVFANFCQVCHGATGQGNGPITQSAFPPPASLLADRAVQMPDGQMFHVLTFGQRNMPAFAAQLSREDRWSVILHVRMLQGAYAPSPVPAPTEVARLFKENCVACHWEDGSGKHLRKVWPLIPDFTSLAWQVSLTETAIVNQIHYGSRPLMPAFRYKLTAEEILRLAVYVRSLAAHPTGLPVVPSSYMTGADVFGSYCFLCHDRTGRGNPEIRQAMPELPDFTAVAWQESHKDTELAQSILLGKGKFMPPMAEKLGAVDVKQMVSLVRAFRGGKHVIPLPAPILPGPSVPVMVGTPSTALPVLGASCVGWMGSRQGQGIFLAASALIRGRTAAPISSTRVPRPKAEQPLPVPSAETAARIRVGESIFRQYCFVCHGLDGKGNGMRPVLPPIPDFTNPAFHQEHSDAQLLVSILDGKGTLMPANRGRVTEDQASSLVAYVRTFGPFNKQFAVQAGGTADSDFDKKFLELQQQWNELEKELQKIGAQK
jgi:mono/diheme cytochrome c family protein